METYTPAKPFVDDPDYHTRRNRAIQGLDLNIIDPPIADIIQVLAEVSYCFTLQSCYGHFVHAGQPDKNNIGPPINFQNTTTIEYRIAYLAVCIQNSKAGMLLHRDLSGLTTLAPEYIQFGSAEWFWKRQTNSYVVQVEPDKFKFLDQAPVKPETALKLHEVRDRMFDELRRLLKNHRALSNNP